MRELVASTRKMKTIIALLDPDTSKGGLSLAQVHAQLLEAALSVVVDGSTGTTALRWLGQVGVRRV